MNTYRISYLYGDTTSGDLYLTKPDDRSAWEEFHKVVPIGHAHQMTRVFVNGVKVNEDVLLYPPELGEGPVDTTPDPVPVCECGRTYCEAHR